MKPNNLKQNDASTCGPKDERLQEAVEALREGIDLFGLAEKQLDSSELKKLASRQRAARKVLVSEWSEDRDHADRNIGEKPPSLTDRVRKGLMKADDRDDRLILRDLWLSNYKLLRKLLFALAKLGPGPQRGVARRQFLALAALTSELKRHYDRLRTGTEGHGNN
jgi:hypothetical protein